MANYVLSAADGAEYPIGSTITQIGRENTCQIMLGDPLVSRIHATLWVEADVLYVRDEYSSNGAFVNEDPIAPEQPRRLSVGDQLRVGNTTFSVRYARVTGNLPSSPPRRSARGATEQTDVGFAFHVPTARPTRPITRQGLQGLSPWIYILLAGLALVATLMLVLGCGALIWIAIR